MAKINSADIGFEKEIWRAADKMRGKIDAAEYKSVVLGLIFLKYISDRFETKYKELIEEGDGMEEGIDEYTYVGGAIYQRAWRKCNQRYFGIWARG